MLVRELLIRQRFNDNIAIKQGENQITYSELFTKSVYLMETLMKKSNPLKNVGIFLPNSINYVIGYFGITFANLIIVPIDVHAKPNEISSMIARYDIGIIVSDSSNIKNVLEKIEHFETSDCIVNIDSEQSYGDIIHNNRLFEFDTGVMEDDVALILQSSGTTNIQKGVMLTHENLISNVQSNIDSHGFSSKEKTLILLPMCFSYCNTAQFLTHVYVGAEIVIYDRIRTGKGILEMIEDEGITNFSCVPFILLMFNKIESLSEYKLQKLSRIFIGAGFMPPDKLSDLLIKFKAIDFIHTYGLTEAGPRVSSLYVRRDFSKPGSVGKPLEDVKVKITDDADFEMEDDNVSKKVGELLVSSKSVMKGYYNDAESTNKTLRQGWLYTGDIAEIDDDGFIYIKGRKKNIINSGGMVIHPEEIEKVLLNYPSVNKALVYAKKHDLLMEIPVAKVVLHDAINEIDAISNIRKHCVNHLASHKVPYEIEIVDALDETESGKIKRYY